MTQKELNTYQKGTDWKEIVKPWIYLLVVGTATAGYTLMLLTMPLK